MRQLDRRQTLPGASNRLAHFLLVLDVNLRHLLPSGGAHVPLLLVGRGQRFFPGGDEYTLDGFALAGIARIDISGAEMAPVLRQQLALFKADVAVPGEALDSEDVAVIDARALGLPLDLRLAVLGDADAVAAADGNVARAVDLVTV